MSSDTVTITNSAIKVRDMYTATYVPADDDPKGCDWVDTIISDVDYRTAYRAILRHARDTFAVITGRHTNEHTSTHERWFVCDSGQNGAYLIASTDETKCA